MPALIALVVFLFFLLGAPQSHAHFRLNVNIRVVHVQHLDDGVRVLLRLPAPYVLAPLAGPTRADGTRAPAPFTSNRMEDGQLMHRFDEQALRRDPQGLGRLVADGHRLVTVDGRSLSPEIEKVRVYLGVSQPPFANLDEALRAFDNPSIPETKAPLYVGDTVIDVSLRYRADGPVHDYEFSSRLDPGLEGQEETANLLLDHFSGEPLVFRERGLLDNPIKVSRSVLRAAFTFVTEGVRHILEGIDHVLFVVCLSLGAIGIGNLLWRVTGFTVGHTVTLILGFLGFVPSGDWFVPSVETGIAVSIIYAGVIAVLDRPIPATVLVTALIGLLHGLGFSFVLQEILRIDSPNLWQSLVAFNVGVEVGQISIVLAVWPAMWLIARRSLRAAQTIRWVLVLPCITIASLWAVERGMQAVRAL